MKLASTWEVPRQSWESFLLEVDALQRDRPVELEISGGSEADGPTLARDARLRAIRAGPGGSGPRTIELELRVGTEGAREHRVLQPSRLYAIQAPSGQLQCLDIEDDHHEKTLVRFKEPRTLPRGSAGAPGQEPDTQVRAYMSAPAHVLQTGSSVADAYEVMKRHDIRHLAIVESDGRLVGVLSDRDVHLAKRERGISPDDVTIEELMIPSPYTVTPETPLDDAATMMAQKKIGCTVVVSGNQVVGMFTTTDALMAFVRLRQLEAHAATSPAS